MNLGGLSTLFLQTDEHQGPWGWLPPNINTAYGTEIDRMYLVIMYVVLAMFILTEAILLYCCFRYRRREGGKSSYSHGNKTAEIVWSAVPALMLFALAMYQTSTWAKVREGYPSEQSAFVVQVFPKQFEWQYRYPGADNLFGTPDDIMKVADFIVPVDRDIVLKMSSQDVIHSFFLPHARVKQDVLPGRMTRSWFRLDRIPCWNLATEKVEYLTEAKFQNTKVLLDGVISPEFAKPYVWVSMSLLKSKEETQVQRFGKKLTHPYYYERNSRITKARVHYQNKIETLTIDEAKPTHILHAIDIACAELCGANHGNMRGFLGVATPEIVDQFMKHRSFASKDEYIVNRWTRVWDNYMKTYNELKK